MDSPPFQDKHGYKQPWRNNAAGKTTGLEVFFKSSEEEYLPNDQRTPGYSVKKYCLLNSYKLKIN